MTGGFSIPPSKIRDFCHLPLGKGGFSLQQNLAFYVIQAQNKRAVNDRPYNLAFIFLSYLPIPVPAIHPPKHYTACKSASNTELETR